jgi:hypothetical protein
MWRRRWFRQFRGGQPSGCVDAFTCWRSSTSGNTGAITCTDRCAHSCARTSPDDTYDARAATARSGCVCRYTGQRALPGRRHCACRANGGDSTSRRARACWAPHCLEGSNGHGVEDWVHQPICL